MATQERGGSSQRTTRAEDDEVVDAAPAAASTQHKEALDSDIDAVLGEIDEVLEENAEDFVRQFVQKGGE